MVNLLAAWTPAFCGLGWWWWCVCGGGFPIQSTHPIPLASWGATLQFTDFDISQFLFYDRFAHMHTKPPGPGAIGGEGTLGLSIPLPPRGTLLPLRWPIFDSAPPPPRGTLPTP
jgi:hypothetical protein